MTKEEKKGLKDDWKISQYIKGGTTTISEAAYALRGLGIDFIDAYNDFLRVARERHNHLVKTAEHPAKVSAMVKWEITKARMESPEEDERQFWFDHYTMQGESPCDYGL